MTKPLSGVVSILVTPFDDDDRLDLPSLARVVEYTVGLGVHGVGIGLASEYLALSDQECVAVAGTVVRTVAGRVPVMMSCGRPSTSATVALAQEIEAQGVDALMVLPPYVMGPSARGIEAHYRAVAAAITTPIVVQDAPALSGVSLAPEVLARLVREVEFIQYLKIETVPPAPKIGEVARLLHGVPQADTALIGGGGGLYLVDELRSGAHATMPGCAYADVFVRIWDRYVAGDLAGARQALRDALPLLVLCNQSLAAFIGTQKEWLFRAGLIASPRLRAPADALSDDVYPAFLNVLDEARR